VSTGRATALNPNDEPTVVAGANVDLEYPGPGGTRRLRAVLAAATTRHLVLDAGEWSGELPEAGTVVSIRSSRGPVEAEVERSTYPWITLHRPATLRVDDTRRSTRVRLKLSAEWRRSGTADRLRAVYLVDLSVHGAKLLAERHVDDAPGNVFDLVYAGDTSRAIIRWVGNHEHGLLCYLGIEFIDMSQEAKQRVIQRIGRLRIDPANLV
jgi:hypothetical protein